MTCGSIMDIKLVHFYKPKKTENLDIAYPKTQREIEDNERQRDYDAEFTQRLGLQLQFGFLYDITKYKANDLGNFKIVYRNDFFDKMLKATGQELKGIPGTSEG